MVWRAYRSIGHQAAPVACPRHWPPRSRGGSKRGRRAADSIGPTGPMKNWRHTCIRRRASRSSAPPCGSSVNAMTCAPIDRRIAIYGATPRSSRSHGTNWRRKKKAQAGECVVLSQDEASSPFVPTLSTTLGVKGHRPLVGTWDNKDQVYCFAAFNLVTGQLTTRLLEQPARSKAKTGHSKQQRLQTAFVAHLRDMARAYPASTFPEVVITIDNAPWHRGAGVGGVLAA